MHIFPTTFREFLRHPGAGSFVRSSAVGYDRAVLWYLVEMFGELIGGNAHGIRQFFVRLRPRGWVPCVEECELFATVQSLFYFVMLAKRVPERSRAYASSTF
jgi:hypothetical protein